MTTRDLNRAHNTHPSSVSDDSDTIVTCSDVTRTYSRGDSRPLSRLRFWRSDPATQRPSVTAVEDVSVSIGPNDYVGFAGPSGSGKSTLLHLLAGLDTPTQGTVTLAGADTGSLSEAQRAHLRLDTVGIVFQQFHLLPSISARTNVAVPLVQYGVRKRKRRERANELLRRVGLDDRTTHKPGELSGGERQRVAIARALVTNPALIVADEPTGELDSETSANVLAIFEELASDHAVVLASHDEQALARTEQRIQLRDGRQVTDE